MTSALQARLVARLLPATVDEGTTRLAAHLTVHGPLPHVANGPAFIEEVARAGLVGRGGAAFPTARKLAAVAGRRAPVVVANGTEGEPASSKDKVLLARSPHLVLDGIVVAAETIGARSALLVVHHAVRDIVDAALAERPGTDPVDISVVTAADRFVAGEASAVVHWIARGVPTPLPKPPRMAERGLGGRPTLVHNVETLAQLALIARHGAAWFRELGTGDEPGSMLVSITGAVPRPCVREIAIGTPVTEILELAGGPSSSPQALLIGGYFGSWVAGTEALALPFSTAGLAAAGATVGAGLIAVLPENACGLVETARVVRYLADESAGQCGPCLFGLAAIADRVERLAHSRRQDVDALRQLLGRVVGRGACSHPDGTVRLAASALSVFADELDRHRRGRCRTTGGREILPVPLRRSP